MEIHPSPLNVFKLPLWKRLFDIVVSSVAILCLSPVFILTALAIKIESSGPLVYKSKRVGSNFVIFDFLKFRSMYTNADKRLKELQGLNQYQKEIIREDDARQALSDEYIVPADDTLVGDDYMINERDYLLRQHTKQDNGFVKFANDPRITKVGRIIRKYSIDELPQLFNVLKGDMSIVGNRPLPVYEAELLTKDDSVDRFFAPAGITGFWQVEKRGDSGAMSAAERNDLDIYYAKNFSFKFDMKIILRTFSAFIQKENV